ncbi:MAG: DNA polymerase III subunit chi [Roseitalea porphyridii]|jgi:DNA polymerase-3 subunit chi|uniref:DNA polymerase III subunit chi n=1 Tax=Roseitalea porphyridii TaxID=1852022 RepID=A0A4V1A3U1_9HYPH|nr:DNA polymerase III subunit chi [Roseitalea porphyridii]QBK30298.1 DNA polymerase III subunit chi [Roseitalea porphyridii]
MTEVTFYHLTETALEAALPGLVEKSLARQWRTVIQVPDAQACEEVDMMLWTHEPVSFLPHGRDGDEPAADHPVFVTASTDNPNGAAIRFVVRGAAPDGDLSAYQRVAIMFDGQDDEAVQQARGHWKTLKADGHTLAYWKQSPEGRWERAA